MKCRRPGHPVLRRRRDLVIACLLGSMLASPAIAAPPVPALVKAVDPSSDYRGGPAGLIAGPAGVFFGVATSSAWFLWKTDGTAAGTKSIAPINNSPDYGASVGGSLVFVAGANGFAGQLWRTDGTAGGTADFASFSHPPLRGSFSGPLGSLLFYRGNHDDGNTYPFATDGTTFGTAALSPSGTNTYPLAFFRAGSSTYYIASTGMTGGVWKTNGTAAGTTLVKALGNVETAIAAGKRAFFSVRTGKAVALWKTDGTVAGTIPVGGPTTSHLDFAGTLDDSVYFWGKTPTTGIEPWVSDGTAAGTKLIEDVNAGPADSMFFDEDYVPMVPCRGAIYFRAKNGTDGYKLFRTDGTAGNTSVAFTIPVLGLEGEAGVSNLTCVNDWLFFSGEDSLNGLPEEHVWMSDGTAQGTVRLEGNFTHTYDKPEARRTRPHSFTGWNGGLYFIGDDGSRGYEIWRVAVPPAPSKPPADGGAMESSKDGGTQTKPTDKDDDSTPDKTSEPIAEEFPESDGAHASAASASGCMMHASAPSGLFAMLLLGSGALTTLGRRSRRRFG